MFLIKQHGMELPRETAESIGTKWQPTSVHKMEQTITTWRTEINTETIFPVLV